MDWGAERAGLGALVWTEEHPSLQWEHWCGLGSALSGLGALVWTAELRGLDW